MSRRPCTSPRSDTTCSTRIGAEGEAEQDGNGGGMPVGPRSVALTGPRRRSTAAGGATSPSMGGRRLRSRRDSRQVMCSPAAHLPSASCDPLQSVFPAASAASPALAIASSDALRSVVPRRSRIRRAAHRGVLVSTGKSAFAPTTTVHALAVPVVPAVREGKLHCPCHNGWFDLQTASPLPVRRSGDFPA